ncbi:hypothetical protein Emag_000692 [Eimeria magna]
MSAFSGALARRGGRAVCLLLLLLLLQQQQGARVAAAAVEPAASAPAPAAAEEEEPAAAAAGGAAVGAGAAAAVGSDVSLPLPPPEAAAAAAAAAKEEAGEDGAAKGHQWPYVSWSWRDKPPLSENAEVYESPFGLGISFRRVSPQELQRMHAKPHHLVKHVSRREGFQCSSRGKWSSSKSCCSSRSCFSNIDVLPAELLLQQQQQQQQLQLLLLLLLLHLELSGCIFLLNFLCVDCVILGCTYASITSSALERCLQSSPEVTFLISSAVVFNPSSSSNKSACSSVSLFEEKFKRSFVDREIGDSRETDTRLQLPLQGVGGGWGDES